MFVRPLYTRDAVRSNAQPSPLTEIFIPSKPDPQVDAWGRTFLDLSNPRLGTACVACSDDFFAPMQRILEPAPAIFIPDKYDDHGKWMDGWESRRKRTPGHDWLVIRLGQPGRIHAFDVDTSHFTGNFPPEASIEAWHGEAEMPPDDADWTPVLSRRPLAGDGHNPFLADREGTWTHLRLNIFPDGGVARLRVFGTVDKDWSRVGDEVVDLAAQVNGGLGVACSDAHYGAPANMIAPGEGANMGDGWETARRRVPGNDWAILKLGHRGRPERALVNTDFFRGNFPDRCALSGAEVEEGTSVEEIVAASEGWPRMLEESKLSADADHTFDLADIGPVTHVRLDIFPDGGVSRLRLWGRKA